MATTAGSTSVPTLAEAPRSFTERLAGRFLRIDPRETGFAVRGFAQCPPWVRRELERHGASFVDGFNAGIATAGRDGLVARLEEVEQAERGFAYEGAAMALALLDLTLPGRPRRLRAFFETRASEHVYMVHVGAGWALARLRRRPWASLPLDPLFRWLALDGYGFHEAFFHPHRVVRCRRVPRRLDPPARRVFDQGVGRALWFADAATPDRIAATIGAFDAERRPDLWSGVGLAAAYAGAIETSGMERLLALAEPFELHLGQGVVFAAKARLRAGNLVPHTERAAGVICGLSAHAAAAIAEDALAVVRRDGTGESYERWRGEIRRRLERR
ncbi:MAG TPA: DUF1702 family protein [Gaiellaceae bacterium]